MYTLLSPLKTSYIITSTTTTSPSQYTPLITRLKSAYTLTQFDVRNNKSPVTEELSPHHLNQHNTPHRLIRHTHLSHLSNQTGRQPTTDCACARQSARCWLTAEICSYEPKKVHVLIGRSVSLTTYLSFNWERWYAHTVTFTCYVLLHSTSQNCPKRNGYQLSLEVGKRGCKVAAHLKTISQNLSGFLVVYSAILVSIYRAVNLFLDDISESVWFPRYFTIPYQFL